MLQGARGYSENMKSNWAHGRQARRWLLSHWTCPAPSERVVPEVTHPVQCGILPIRLPLPRPDDQILSGYNEDVSSKRDGYTPWGISDPDSTLVRHLACAGSAKAVYRDAHDRRHSSPKPEFRFDNGVPNRLLEETRLSILSWNPGRQRGREGAIEGHIAGKWHVIASRITFTLPTTLAVLSCSTRTPLTQTSKSSPFTSTTPGNIKP